MSALQSAASAAAIVELINRLQAEHEAEIKALKAKHAEEVKALKAELEGRSTKTETGLDTSTIFQDKDQFVQFIKAAVSGSDTPEFLKLYHFLLKCFTDADNNFDGRVGFKEFEVLIETAAFMPRRFGFAPSTAELYPTVWDQTASRLALFNSLERKTADMVGENGEVQQYEYISFHSWLNYAVRHIKEKAKLLNELCGQSQTKRDTRESFIAFIRSACGSRSSTEYKELYHFALKCFTEVDLTLEGRIGSDGFHDLLDKAAEAPRWFGFKGECEADIRDLQSLFSDVANSSPNQAEKRAARQEIFKSIDTKGRGFIDFDMWLHYIFEHICEKAKQFGVSGSIPLVAGVCPSTDICRPMSAGYSGSAAGGCPFKFS